MEEEIENLNDGKNTYIFGDFNARIKTVCENIAQDKSDETLGIQTTIEVLHPPRNSEDQKLVNKRGHDFLDLCRVNDLTIANGRTVGDLYGHYTCHQKRGSSVVDYLITPHKTLKNISHFQVGKFVPLLSDHCPLMATIQLHRNLKIEEEKEVEMNDLPKRVQWDDKKILSYREELGSQKYKEEVEKLINKPNGVVTAEEIQKLLMKVDKPEEPTTLKTPGKKNPKKTQEEQ